MLFSQKPNLLLCCIGTRSSTVSPSLYLVSVVQVDERGLFVHLSPKTQGHVPLMLAHHDLSVCVGLLYNRQLSLWSFVELMSTLFSCPTFNLSVVCSLAFADVCHVIIM